MSVCDPPLPPGEVFTGMMDKYLRRGLHKGVHSLFMSIRTVYTDPVKVSSQSFFLDLTLLCFSFHFLVQYAYTIIA